jgi:hypothetical protein
MILLTSDINNLDLLLGFLGTLMLGNSIFGFKLRSSIRWSLIYSMIITSLFLFDIFLTLAVVHNTEMILDWVIREKKKNLATSIDDLKHTVSRNINVMNDLLWSVSFLLVKEVFI